MLQVRLLSSAPWPHSPTAEATGSGPVQCGFDSLCGYQFPAHDPACYRLNMGFSEQLTRALTEATWKRNSDGSFTGVGFKQGDVKLHKPDGKNWVMTVKGQDHALGRKASFTTAEKKLATIR